MNPEEEMNPEELKRFKSFLNERRRILEDIRTFLRAVLLHFIDMEDTWNINVKEVATEYGKSLIESLCLIHGLYGYPAKTDGTGSIKVDKDAIRKMLRDDIKEKNKKNEMVTFECYCEQAGNDEFWQFGFSNGTSCLESSPREPAHIFLQMVQKLFCEYKNKALASVIGRTTFEGLRDSIKLKPKVWAEHKSKPELFGVSLGVRSFVRPLYLYLKLSQLRKFENDDNGVKLEDVNAYQSTCIKITEDASTAPIMYKYMKSKEEHIVRDKDLVKKPCDSCKIFFDGFKSVNLFGNCAEYDVIRTKKLDDLLSGTHWNDFKSACEKHFIEFNKLTEMLKAPENISTKIETYYNQTRNAKVLMYEWNSQKQGFDLVAKNWPIENWHNIGQ